MSFQTCSGSGKDAAIAVLIAHGSSVVEMLEGTREIDSPVVIDVLGACGNLRENELAENVAQMRRRLIELAEISYERIGFVLRHTNFASCFATSEDKVQALHTIIVWCGCLHVMNEGSGQTFFLDVLNREDADIALAKRRDPRVICEAARLQESFGFTEDDHGYSALRLAMRPKAMSRREARDLCYLNEPITVGFPAFPEYVDPFDK